MDIVVEREDGVLIVVEVKAAASVKEKDFKGLRKLAGACGRMFKSGVL